MPKGIAKNGKRQCSPRVEHVIRVCEVCGKERQYMPSEIRQREERTGCKIRFCSTSCRDKARERGNTKYYTELSCEHCNKSFKRLTSHIKESHNYCSPKCNYAARSMKDAKWRDQSYIKSYMAEYQKQNREKINVLGRTWVRENKAKRLAILKKYSETHKTEITNRYHQRKKQINGGTFTEEDWQTMKQDYNCTCLRCKRQEPEITLTMDHIQPITKGGSHHKENIQPLCKSCNSHKGTKTIDYRANMKLVGFAS